MKHTILQDSSFVIAYLNEQDALHKDAIEITSKLLKHKDKFKILIPSIVFFETIIKLIQRGIKPEYARKYLWNYLFEDEVLNFSLLETAAFRMSKQLVKSKIELRTSDAIIALVGMEFESQILTFDKDMAERLQGIDYSQSYYCIKETERSRFFNDLDKTINK